MNPWYHILHDFLKDPSNHAHGVGFSLIRGNGSPRLSRTFIGNWGHSSTNAFRDDSFLWLASATKIVKATAVLIAVQKGLIQLDDCVVKYIPEIAKLDILVGFKDTSTGGGKPILRSTKNTMTIRHLMTHTSGLAYLFTTKELRKSAEYHKRRSDELSSSMEDCYHPLLFEPGTGWAYGPGIDWAGRIHNALWKNSANGTSGTEWELTIQHFDLKNVDLLERRLYISRPTSDGGIKVKEEPYPLEPLDDLGGIGLWTTPRDFDLFMWHLFLTPNLLTAENMYFLLRPQILDSKLVTHSIHASTGGILTRVFPNNFPLNVGLSTCITLANLRGRRPKGSISWLGYPNIYWWFDPKNRIIGILYMQLIPAGLRNAAKLLIDIETLIYSDVERDTTGKSSQNVEHKL